MTPLVRSRIFRAMLGPALIGLLLVLQPHVASALGDGPAVVRPDPVESVAGINQTVTVTIHVEDVAELYGADVRLAFDPTVLQVVDADSSAAGVQIAPRMDLLKPDFVVKRKACNAADPGDPDCRTGGLVWYAATQVNPSTPATGSGALAAITFRRIAPGEAHLRIRYRELVTRTGQTIAAQTVEGRIMMPSGGCHLWLPLTAR